MPWWEYTAGRKRELAKNGGMMGLHLLPVRAEISKELGMQERTQRPIKFKNRF